MISVGILSLSILHWASAWPIEYDHSRKANIETISVVCGSKIHEHLSAERHIRIVLTSAHMKSECVSQIGFSIPNTFVKRYGIVVKGDIDMVDKNNDAKCSSSKLFITDAEDEKDKDAIERSFCGTKAFNYETFQDSVNLLVNVSSASGRGFNITVEPVFDCGDIIDSKSVDKSIVSPRYPKVYPNNIMCIWEVKVGKDESAEIECTKFKVKKMNGKRPIHYLLMEIGGQYTYHTNTDLAPPNKYKFIKGDHVVIFRSNNSSPPPDGGFYCNVKYSDTRSQWNKLKSLLHIN